MNSYVRATHWLLIGGWVLMTPPTPLRTALPPLSEWSKVSTHTSSEECERNRERMREAARRTVATDASAHAMQVAAALGQLQSRCVEVKDKKPAAAEQAAAPAGSGTTAAPPASDRAAAPSADPPIANPPVANQPAGKEPAPVTDDAVPKP
jgi:hypothetical protein